MRSKPTPISLTQQAKMEEDRQNQARRREQLKEINIARSTTGRKGSQPNVQYLPINRKLHKPVAAVIQSADYSQVKVRVVAAEDLKKRAKAGETLTNMQKGVIGYTSVVRISKKMMTRQMRKLNNVRRVYRRGRGVAWSGSGMMVGRL